MSPGLGTRIARYALVAVCAATLFVVVFQRHDAWRDQALSAAFVVGLVAMFCGGLELRAPRPGTPGPPHRFAWQRPAEREQSPE